MVGTLTMKVLRPEILLVVMTGAANADRTYTAPTRGAEGLTTTTERVPSKRNDVRSVWPVADGGGTYNSIACATDGAGVCNCDAVSSVMASTEIGTYSISGGR